MLSDIIPVSSKSVSPKLTLEEPWCSMSTKLALCLRSKPPLMVSVLVKIQPLSVPISIFKWAKALQNPSNNLSKFCPNFQKDRNQILFKLPFPSLHLTNRTRNQNKNYRICKNSWQPKTYQLTVFLAIWKTKLKGNWFNKFCKMRNKWRRTHKIKRKGTKNRTQTVKMRRKTTQIKNWDRFKG